jgi:cytoskeletal protein RodZ
MFEKKFGSGGAYTARIIKKLSTLWIHWYKTVFFILFFGICIWGGFLWYYSLYYFQWSPERKQAYIDSQSHQTVLNEKGFKNALEIIDHRANAYQSEPVSVKNIFRTQADEMNR